MYVILDSSPHANPVLFRLAQQNGFEEYLSRFDKVEDATFILDSVLPASWKQYDGSKNLKQVLSEGCNLSLSSFAIHAKFFL
jgi:hypothetical protein